MAVLPDIDLLFPFIQHRGPTHSIIVAIIAFIPLLIIYRKEALPYLIAYVQHGLVGDYIAGGQVQLLWPLTRMYFGTRIDIRSPANVTIEWIMFLVACIMMLALKDFSTFFKAHWTNLVLTIPTFTVLLPTMLGFPLGVPLLLTVPHVFYFVLFAAAILVELHHLSKPTKSTGEHAHRQP